MIAGLLPKIAGMEHGRAPYRVRPSGVTVKYDGEIHGRCNRANVYDRLGFYPAPTSGRMMIVLNDSSWHEELTADWIRKSAYRLHSEQMGIDCFKLAVTLPEWHCTICHKSNPATRDVDGAGCHARGCTIAGDVLHGHIDGILQDLMGGHERLYEHKAINHFTFQSYWKGELPIAYIAQPCCYLVGLRKLIPPEDCPREIVLLIKNKMTSQYLDYLIEYDADDDTAYIEEMEHSGYGVRTFTPPLEIPGLVNSAVEYWEETENFYQHSKKVGAAVLPPRPFDYDSWQCSYCPFGGEGGGVCWENYLEEFQELQTNVDLGYDLAAMMKEERSLAAVESKAKKDRESLRETFRKIIRDELGARSGRAALPDGTQFTFNLKLDKRKKTDNEKIPPDILLAAQVESFQETLTIREVKDERSES